MKEITIRLTDEEYDRYVKKGQVTSLLGAYCL
jgi:hypothetical protein